ncbi:zinc transporter ZntB [Alteromonas sp. ASW11-19]|uniref:Zinc transporter ZntB n=1 Tax=Alteromonas salexigens TaxID=2982530 RepID=A0ABT2VPE1_9ALTE|nr:zinc transporter ZntB [Alteromonas salexigens]MCU7554747.1 zinc transporter ZntB [Alteromonas salexigens]
MSDSGESSFLWAYHILPSGEVSRYEPPTAPPAVPDEGFLWLHMQSDAPDSADIMANLAMPAPVIDAITPPETRPRALAVLEGAVVYLRALNHNPDAALDDMVSLRVWMTDRLIVTARRQGRSVQSLADVRKRIEGRQPPLTAPDLLINIIESVADRIHEVVDDIEDTLVACETAEELDRDDREQLAALRRQAASLRRFLAPQRDALEALHRLPDLLTSEQAFDLREESDRMTRYVEELDLARERAIMLQDELRNRIADRQNVRMYVLSMVTAIFLPLSFLTGVFGMNVAGLPGTESPDAFNTLMWWMGGLAAVMLIAMLWRRWL